MRDNTIQHPALLGHHGRWARELRRLDAASQHPGLFEAMPSMLPPAAPDLADVQGHPPAKRAALRALQTLAQAFGLGEAAQTEWYRLFAFGEAPQPDGPLLAVPPEQMEDLLRRAFTFCQIRDRSDALGGRYAQLWANARALRPAQAAARHLAGLGLAGSPTLGFDRSAGRMRRPGLEDRHGSVRALFWQLRARLLMALCEPPSASAQDGRVTIQLARSIEFEFDTVNRTARWGFTLHPGGLDPLRNRMISRFWSVVSTPQAMVIGWFVKQQEAFARSLPVDSLLRRRALCLCVCRQLSRDPLVLALAARLAHALSHHPAVPRDALALTLRAYRLESAFGQNPQQLQWVWQQPALYRALCQQAPSLLCLMPAVHRWMEANPAAAVSPPDLGSLRSLVLRMGLLPAAWRWLANSPDDPCRSAMMVGVRRWFDPRAVVWRINLVALSRQPNTAQLLNDSFAFDMVWSFWRRRGVEPTEAALTRLAWVLDRATAHLMNAGIQADAMRPFLSEQLNPVLYWMFDQSWRPDSNQRRAPWPAIERAYRRALARVEPNQPHWPGLKGPIEWQGLQAICLDSVHALAREGLEMEHCIADYSASALEGRFLAFSVCDETGRRVATFSFKRSDTACAWLLDQCHGPANAPCDDPRVKPLMEWVHVHLITGAVP